MNQVSFRPGHDTDREWVWTTKQACLRRYVEQTFGQWNETDQRERFDRNYVAQEIRIVSVGGIDVGYIATTCSPGELRLFNIMVLPAFQRQGIGTVVLQRLMAEARASHVPLRLQVLRVNPARRLYQRLGFADTGETDTYFQMQWIP